MRNMNNFPKPTKKGLEELKNQTKDKFTKLMINQLTSWTGSSKIDEFHEKLAYETILNLIEKEKMREEVKNYKPKKIENNIFDLRVTKRSGKKRDISVKWNDTFEDLSYSIQREFGLESGHLYEFNMGKLKIGPECDDWQEIFDVLDNLKTGHVISFMKLKKQDSFKFLYDFGENIGFRIQIRT